jgi:hypothetical protein
VPLPGNARIDAAGGVGGSPPQKALIPAIREFLDETSGPVE